MPRLKLITKLYFTILCDDGAGQKYIIELRDLFAVSFVLSHKGTYENKWKKNNHLICFGETELWLLFIMIHGS